MNKNNENDTPTTTKAALRRLLIVLAIVIGFAIYSYGWTVTDIDLETPQEEKRLENVSNALRELLAPRIFEQDYDQTRLVANFRIGCIEGETVEQPDMSRISCVVQEDEDRICTGGGEITITPDCGESGDEVFIEVGGGEPGAYTGIRWVPADEDAETRPRNILETGRDSFLFNSIVYNISN